MAGPDGVVAVQAAAIGPERRRRRTGMLGEAELSYTRAMRDPGHPSRDYGLVPAEPLSPGSEEPSRLVMAALLWWCWATAVASALVFLVYPRLASSWQLAAAQVTGYAVLASPVFVARCDLTLASTRCSRPLSLGVGLACLAGAFGSLVTSLHGATYLAQTALKLGAAGLVEEVVFRGAIWSILRNLGLRAPLLVALDVGSFVLWHLPSVLSGDGSWTSLPTIAAFGVVFSLARLATGGLELPVLLHVAADIAGV